MLDRRQMLKGIAGLSLIGLPKFSAASTNLILPDKPKFETIEYDSSETKIIERKDRLCVFYSDDSGLAHICDTDYVLAPSIELIHFKDAPPWRPTAPTVGYGHMPIDIVQRRMSVSLAAQFEDIYNKSPKTCLVHCIKQRSIQTSAFYPLGAQRIYFTKTIKMVMFG